ncbi:putative ribosomally synthesized peptide [Streptomyces sp. 840.1]|uniref:hypothetical protein n=1 Tax=Streptomyces sp. 840.1 TaxID=2485152 RepID=UPI000F48F158|nr:hypothetical protein [Streptomyces sp. 840.1]ROQ68875.1 putative ribosomally synthesized peptide [Streptomyces sp. 840.1]
MSGKKTPEDAIPTAPATAPTPSYYAQNAPFPPENPWWPDKTQNEYAMTFVNSSGESAFGPWSSWGGSGYALAYLVDLATDPEGTATQRNIYRRSQTEGCDVQPAVLVGTLDDNTTTDFQEEEPPPPTAAQVALAITNIENEMDWLTNLHSYFQDIIQDVYSHLSEDGSTDPGESFVANLIDDALWGIGGVDFKGNAFFSAAVANIFWGYVTETPPTLQGVMGGVWDRFYQSFLQAEHDLSVIHDDVAGNWSTTWTNPNTGETATAWTMASPELAVPDKYSEAFQDMTDDAVAAYKVSLTKTLLPVRWFVLLADVSQFVESGDYTSPADYIENMLSQSGDTFDAYYLTWQTDTDTVYSQKGIDICENYLGTGPDDWYTAEKAPDDLSNWLFQDDGYGRITNPLGVATRHDVFCNWGLQNSLPTSAPNCGPFGSGAQTGHMQIADIDAERRKAQEWHKLFKHTDRQLIERRLIDRAQADPAFLRALVREPKETIEAFLGLPIPAGVEFEVVQERPGRFRMVLPLRFSLEGSLADSAHETRAA